MRYKAILFDNDDTLMDFQAGNRIAVNRLMDSLGTSIRTGTSSTRR